jgi:hypothetical protein
MMFDCECSGARLGSYCYTTHGRFPCATEVLTVFARRDTIFEALYSYCGVEAVVAGHQSSGIILRVPNPTA